MAPDEIATKKDVDIVLREVVNLREQLNELLTTGPKSKKVNMLTRHQVAGKLQISLSTVDKLTREGVLRGIKYGRNVRFNEQEIEAAMQQIQESKYRHRQQ